MERLTEEKQIGPWASLKDKAEAIPGAFANYDCLMAHMTAVTRLKAYEDTGLTPAEIKSMQGEHFTGLEMAKLHSALMELKKYQEADKDGRLVVRPCKVGDTLFRVFAGEILEHKVGNMRYLAIQGRWDIDTTPFCSYVESSIGKTIFLTREKAEKALEGKRNA